VVNTGSGTSKPVTVDMYQDSSNPVGSIIPPASSGSSSGGSSKSSSSSGSSGSSGGSSSGDGYIGTIISGPEATIYINRNDYSEPVFNFIVSLFGVESSKPTNQINPVHPYASYSGIYLAAPGAIGIYGYSSISAFALPYPIPFPFPMPGPGGSYSDDFWKSFSSDYNTFKSRTNDQSWMKNESWLKYLLDFIFYRPYVELDQNGNPKPAAPSKGDLSGNPASPPNPNDPNNWKNDNKNYSDKENTIAQRTGYTKQQVKDAIHQVKQNIPRTVANKNPDVVVNTTTGEVYPKLSGGRVGDSIGNIFHYLP